jgi:hypothetical protein
LRCQEFPAQEPGVLAIFRIVIPDIVGEGGERLARDEVCGEERREKKHEAKHQAAFSRN